MGPDAYLLEIVAADSDGVCSSCCGRSKSPGLQLLPRSWVPHRLACRLQLSDGSDNTACRCCHALFCCGSQPWRRARVEISTTRRRGSNEQLRQCCCARRNLPVNLSHCQWHSGT